MPKKNTEKHYYRCPNAYYTCIDCSKTFEDGVSYKNHTSCISEDEKYQKALYKGNKKQKQKQQQKQQQKQHQHQPVATPAKKVEKPVIKKAEKVEKTSNGIELHKGKSLYKILKTMKDKGAKKTFLKSLVVDSEGQIRYAKE